MITVIGVRRMAFSTDPYRMTVYVYRCPPERKPEPEVQVQDEAVVEKNPWYRRALNWKSGIKLRYRHRLALGVAVYVALNLLFFALLS